MTSPMVFDTSFVISLYHAVARHLSLRKSISNIWYTLKLEGDKLRHKQNKTKQKP